MGPKKKRRCEKPSPVPEGKETIPVLMPGLPTKAVHSARVEDARPRASIFLDSVLELSMGNAGAAGGAAKREEHKAPEKAPVKVGLQMYQIQVNYHYEAQRDASGTYYTCAVLVINTEEQQCYVQWEDGTESSYVKIDAMRFQLVTLSDSE